MKNLMFSPIITKVEESNSNTYHSFKELIEENDRLKHENFNLQMNIFHLMENPNTNKENIHPNQINNKKTNISFVTPKKKRYSTSSSQTDPIPQPSPFVIVKKEEKNVSDNSSQTELINNDETKPSLSTSSSKQTELIHLFNNLHLIQERKENEFQDMNEHTKLLLERIYNHNLALIEALREQKKENQLLIEKYNNVISTVSSQNKRIEELTHKNKILAKEVVKQRTRLEINREQV
ncbi:hypothetical protein ABK040_004363 [Willaertia magna]